MTTSFSDFFKHHGPWSPGVRLFRRLRFRSKAILISFMLLLPAIILGAAYLVNVQEQISFTNKERAGVGAMQKFVPVLQGVIEAKTASRASLGEFDVANEYKASRQKVDSALSEFESVLQQSGDPLGLKESFEGLRSAWVATASAKNGIDSQGQIVFSAVTERALKVLKIISDDSNLVLDPDIDALYLINGLFLSMPKTSEDLGQIVGWATFGVARSGLESPEQYRRFAVWSARTAGAIEDTMSFFQRAFDASPKLKGAIDIKGFDEALKFQKEADTTEMIKAALEPSEVFSAGQKALRAYFTVFDSALPALDGLLLNRLDRLKASLLLKSILVVVCLLLAVYFLYCFSRVMDGGLQEVARHLDNMAEGDLTRSPKPWGNDEAANLMRSLERMQVAMRQIVFDVRDSSHGIVQASGEISSGSMDLSKRTEETATGLQATAATLNTITTALGQTTQNTERAAHLASENAVAAERGGKVISEAVSNMTQINTASTRINDITGVIDGIAFQTNLLALNAAVEAARAGEQGRGFAVVAAEVRSLAQRSASAAREIKTLITATVESVQAGTVVVEQAGLEMKHLVEGAQGISTVVHEISMAAKDQSESVRQVGNTVNALDKMTQHNAALVEETASAAGLLLQRSDALIAAVSKFQIEHDHH